MSAITKIEWTEATWSPVSGCTRVSDGCRHCYIERTPPFRMAHRRFDHDGIGATTGVQLHPERLAIPLHWRKPKRIFVCSMADLFHDDVPDKHIAKVWAVMAYAHWHTFQVLTKRHKRLQTLLSSERFVELFDREFCRIPDWNDRYPDPDSAGHLMDGPLPNVWLGVSTENQRWADIRIPALLGTPAAVRFISAEPLLGPITLRAEWLEWSNGRRVEQRERSLPSSGVGRVVDRLSGADLETCGAPCESVGSWNSDNPMYAAPRGESNGQVSASAGDVRRQADSCTCSQAGLAALQRPHPSGPHGEPQERATVRQSPIESGAFDQSRADPPFSTHTASRPTESVRPTQSDGEAVDGASSGDLLASGGRGAVDIDSSGLRCCAADHLEDHSGRPALAWIITGGESGPGARPAHPDWFRSIRDQCQAAGVAYLHKQNGEWRMTVDVPPDQLPERAAEDLAHGDYFLRVGKKRAGRELDGRTHDGYPEVVSRG